MGHELGGEIVAVGAHTDGWSEGTNVAVLPVISCGSCRYCRAGLVSHCPKASYIGMGPAGGFAEYAAAPGDHCFALPKELPADYSALVEPFAVGLHGVHSAEIGPGDDVLVVGAGGVGLTTLVWALHKGGGRVTVADPDPRRRDSARSMGATDVLASVPEAECGAYDAVVECVGRPELLQACQPVLGPRGRLVVSGACAEPTAIEPITALLKEITVAILRRLLDRGIPRGRRRVQPRGHRPGPHDRADIRTGPGRRSFRCRPRRAGARPGVGEAMTVARAPKAFSQRGQRPHRRSPSADIVPGFWRCPCRSVRTPAGGEIHPGR